MKRFVVISIAVGLCALACKKAPDATARDGNKPAATDSQRVAAATSPLPDSSGNREGSNVSTAKPTPDTLAETPSDVTGAYFAVDKWPAAFSEIDYMGLATIDDQGKPSPLNGFIRPKKKSAEDYHLVDPKLSGNDLTFSTQTIGGVSYSFTGTFVKLGDFPNNPPQDVVLKGTLTKMKGDAKVAETPVSFTYSAGG